MTMLLEVVGPDPHAPIDDAVFYRTVIDSDVASQRAASDRLVPLLPSDRWRVVIRPLGTLDGIEESMQDRHARLIAQRS